MTQTFTSSQFHPQALCLSRQSSCIIPFFQSWSGFDAMPTLLSEFHSSGMIPLA